MSTIEKFNEHIMPTYGRFDVVMEKGEKETFAYIKAFVRQNKDY